MNVNPDRFTELGISAIQEMAEVAKRNGQQEVEVWHLLSALMNQENGIVPSLMDEMVYSISRTYTPGISHPTKDSKFFVNYKNFFLDQIKEKKIQVIYTIKPYDSYIYDSILSEECVKEERINDIMKKHTLFQCKELD